MLSLEGGGVVPWTGAGPDVTQMVDSFWTKGGRSPDPPQGMGGFKSSEKRFHSKHPSGEDQAASKCCKYLMSHDNAGSPAESNMLTIISLQGQTFTLWCDHIDKNIWIAKNNECLQHKEDRLRKRIGFHFSIFLGHHNYLFFFSERAVFLFFISLCFRKVKFTSCPETSHEKQFLVNSGELAEMLFNVN